MCYRTKQTNPVNNKTMDLSKTVNQVYPKKYTILD